jgi:hypothetical protein
MEIDFNCKSLDTLLQVFTAGPFGPSIAFRFYYQIPVNEAISTQEVEDFAMAFMTAANRVYPETF